MSRQTNKVKISCLASISFMLVSCAVFAQKNPLRQRIEQIVSAKKAQVGVSILGIEDKYSLSINNNKFPMQSVFKFHIALAVLDAVDRGRLSLNQKVFIPKKDLQLNTWSPIREKYPNGNVEMSLAEILKYTVAQSDNNGCDILLGLIGGPKTVNDYIHKIGVKDVSIKIDEKEMHKNFNAQFSNWTTPSAATKLLETFYNRKILSANSFEFLWNTMTETQTGQNRIKGKLPKGTQVAHKTGTSGTDEHGVTAAVNDIGIVTLPSGRHFAVAVFVSSSKEDNNTNEKIIADIAEAAWDYFVGKKK